MSDDLPGWTAEDAAAAAEEGWNLFEDEAGRPQVGADADPAIFTDDMTPYRHVASRAAAGSALHRRALDVIEGRR